MGLTRLHAAHLAGLLAFAALVPSGALAQLGSVPGQTPFQSRVGSGVQTTCGGLIPLGIDPGGSSAIEDLFGRCTELVVTSLDSAPPGFGGFELGLSDDELNDALLNVGHEEFSMAGVDSINIVTSTFGTLETRMVALREGVRGIQIAGAFADVLDPRHGGADLGRALREDSAAGDVLGDRLGVFLNGAGNWGDFDGNNEEAAFDFFEGGVTGGVDYRFTDQVVAGVALGGLFSDADFTRGASGDLDRNAIVASLYGSFEQEGFYVDGIASYSKIYYDLARDIDYLGRTANGDTDADEWAVALGTGYSFSSGAWSFGPYLRVEYIDVDVDGFSESGALGMNLRYDDTDIRSLVTDLGARVEYAWSLPGGIVTPYLRAAWKHEFENDSRRVNVSFAADPARNEFFLRTADPDRDYANLGLGMAFTFPNGFSAFVDFDTLLGLREVERYTITAGARLQF